MAGRVNKTVKHVAQETLGQPHCLGSEQQGDSPTGHEKAMQGLRTSTHNSRLVSFPLLFSTSQRPTDGRQYVDEQFKFESLSV